MLNELIGRYTQMLINMVQAEDFLHEHGVDALKERMNLVDKEATAHDAYLILTSFQTALTNILNDLERVEAAQRAGKEN